MKRLKKLSLFISAGILLSSCHPHYVRSVCSVPPEPAYPVLTIEQESSIPDDVYQILVQRDMIKSARIEELEGMIRVLCD